MEIVVVTVARRSLGAKGETAMRVAALRTLEDRAVAMLRMEELARVVMRRVEMAPAAPGREETGAVALAPVVPAR